MMQHPGWILIATGLLIAGIGFAWLLFSGVPWPGKLPGDIVLQRENFRFYFPVATCVIVSLVVSAIIWLVRHLLR